MSRVLVWFKNISYGTNTHEVEYPYFNCYRSVEFLYAALHALQVKADKIALHHSKLS